MAGLIGLQASDIDIQDALGAIRWRYEGEWVPHPVVRLTTTLPVAVNEAASEEGGEAGRSKDGMAEANVGTERVVVRARWGFDVGAGRPIGNARDDKLLESRLWGSMLGKSHCLVAATAIYEQVKKGKEKTSYWFRRRDGKPIVMPGLAGERGAKGEKRLCAAIVTTEPNDFFGQFHTRQVCTLTDREADAWMLPGEPKKLAELLHAPTNEEWEAVPVEGVFVKGIVNEEDIKVQADPVRWKG